MRPERLAELQSEAYARFWSQMQAKRAARQEYIQATGHPPPPGMPPQFQRYWNGKAKKLKAESTADRRLVKRVYKRLVYAAAPQTGTKARLHSLARALKESLTAIARIENTPERTD
jgi:hypothetical protein